MISFFVNFNADNLYDIGWIYAYEVLVKGWGASPTANYVANDPFFSELMQANVEFYDSAATAPTVDFKPVGSPSPSSAALLLEYLDK